VDDTPQRDAIARILSVLESRFDLVLRSCHAGARIPEPDIFNNALEKLAVKPEEVGAVNEFKRSAVENWQQIQSLLVKDVTKYYFNVLV